MKGRVIINKYVASYVGIDNELYARPKHIFIIRQLRTCLYLWKRYTSLAYDEMVRSKSSKCAPKILLQYCYLVLIQYPKDLIEASGLAFEFMLSYHKST